LHKDIFTLSSAYFVRCVLCRIFEQANYTHIMLSTL